MGWWMQMGPDDVVDRVKHTCEICVDEPPKHLLELLVDDRREGVVDVINDVVDEFGRVWDYGQMKTKLR